VKTLTESQVAALCETFCVRAETYRRKASEADNSREAVMFTAFASTLKWAVREICLTAGMASTEANSPIEEAAPECPFADEAHDAEDAQSSGRSDSPSR